MTNRRGLQHASNIMDALSGSSRPLSAYDLLDRLRPTGVAAPLTVYRALDKLIASGKVHRVESLNAFVACRNGEHHHVQDADEQARRTVAFMICDRCGSVQEFVDADLVDGLDRRLAEMKFDRRSAAIEVHGVCECCTAA